MFVLAWLNSKYIKKKEFLDRMKSNFRKVLYGIGFAVVIMLMLVYINTRLEKQEEKSVIDTVNLVKVYENSPKEKTMDSVVKYAYAAALMDANAGRFLYKKNADILLPMASTTKILTCIVVIENTDLEDLVTISHNASIQPKVRMGVAEGEKYYVKDLLYALMLESYNDVAVALAEHVGGSVEGFASLMNNKATELGCTNTHFVTPNGLDADGHYTTAAELCMLAAYAIQNKTFIEITNTREYTLSEVSSGRLIQVNNKNRFLTEYNGAIGVKTGFTGKAGYCFVGAAKRGDMLLVSSVLACGWPPNKSYKWTDTKALMDYGFHNFKEKEIFPSKITLPKCQVKQGKKDELKLGYQEFHMSIASDESEFLTIYLELSGSLVAPIKKGSKVGCLYYFLDKEEIACTNVYALEEIEQLSIIDTIKIKLIPCK